jgi:hypothetical protein
VQRRTSLLQPLATAWLSYRRCVDPKIPLPTALAALAARYGDGGLDAPTSPALAAALRADAQLAPLAYALATDDIEVYDGALAVGDFSAALDCLRRAHHVQHGSTVRVTELCDTFDIMCGMGPHFRFRELGFRLDGRGTGLPASLD